MIPTLYKGIAPGEDGFPRVMGRVRSGSSTSGRQAQPGDTENKTLPTLNSEEPENRCSPERPQFGNCKGGEVLCAVRIDSLALGREGADRDVVDQPLAQMSDLDVARGRGFKNERVDEGLGRSGRVGKQRGMNSLGVQMRLIWTVLGMIAVTAGSAGCAQDGALTSEEIRELLARMTLVGNLSKADCKIDPPTCQILRRQTKKCLALKEKILSSQDDIVLPPLLEMETYDQSEVDKYAGRCRGARLNESHYAVKGNDQTDITSSTLRIYRAYFFNPHHLSLVVFGRSYKPMIPTYLLKEGEPHRGYDNFQGRLKSLLSYVDEKKCEALEFEDMYQTQFSTYPGGNTSDVKYDYVSIIKTTAGYYIAEHFREEQSHIDKHKTDQEFFRLGPLKQAGTGDPEESYPLCHFYNSHLDP